MKLISTLSLILLASSFALFSAPKVAPDLEGLKPGTKVDVIIQFVNPAMEKSDNAAAKGGAQKIADLSLIGASVYSVPANALKGLSNNPNVRYISPDRAVKPRLDYATPAVFGDIVQSNG